MKVIVKKSVLESVLKMLVSEDRSYRSPRIDYIEGKGVSQEVPVLPNPEIPAISFEEADVDDPDFVATNTKSLADAAATIARHVPHGQESFFYEKMKGLFDDAESRDRAVKFMNEREERARTRVLGRILNEAILVLKEAEDTGNVKRPAREKVPETPLNQAATALFDVITPLTKSDYVKKTFGDSALERERFKIYVRARNAMRSRPRDYFGLSLAASELLTSILDNPAAVSIDPASPTGTRPNPETALQGQISELIERLDRLAVPSGVGQTAAQYAEQLAVPQSSVLPPDSVYEDEDLGELFIAIKDSFIENKDEILKDLVKSAGYIKLRKKVVPRRTVSGGVADYKIKGLNMVYDEKMHSDLRAEMRAPNLIRKNANDITVKYIQTDSIVDEELEKFDVESDPEVPGTLRIVDPDIRARVSIFIQILFSPYTRALASIGEDLDIAANRQLDMIFRYQSGGRLDSLNSNTAAYLSTLRDTVRDDLMKALVSVKLEGINSAGTSDEVVEPEMGAEPEILPFIPGEITAEPDESPDFTKNLNALAPLFGYANASGIRQWINKYPLRIAKFQMRAEMGIEGYRDWSRQLMQAGDALIAAISDQMDEIIDTTYDQDIKKILMMCQPDIEELNLAIADEDSDEIARRMKTLGGGLFREINSNLFVRPTFTKYPGDLSLAIPGFLKSKGVSDPTGMIRKMMIGETAFPRSLSEAKPKVAATLRMFGLDDQFLEDAHKFVEVWTNNWLKKGSAHFRALSEKIVEVSNNPVAIRSAILAAVPEVKEELTYSIARQRVMTPDAPGVGPTSAGQQAQVSPAPSAPAARGVDKNLKMMALSSLTVPPRMDSMKVVAVIGGKTVNFNVAASDVVDPDIARKEYIEDTGEEPPEGMPLFTEKDVDISLASVDNLVEEILTGLGVEPTPDNISFFNRKYRDQVMQALAGATPISQVRISKPTAVSGKVIRRRK